MIEDNIKYSARSVNKVLYNKQKWRKNNEVVAAMYAMYCVPHSLDYIGKVYNKSRQAIFSLFKTRGYKLRSKQHKGSQILDNINFSLNCNGLLVGYVGKKRTLMHRYVWEKKYGEIPADHFIIHKDGNKENNKLSNLKMIDRHDFSPRVTNNKKLKK